MHLTFRLRRRSIASTEHFRQPEERDFAMRLYDCVVHTRPQALHSNVMRVWLLTYSVRGTISGCSRFSRSTNRSCVSFNLPAQPAHPEPRRRVVGTTDHSWLQTLHRTLILSLAFVYSPITSILSLIPASSAPEFFGGYPPRIQFGLPPDLRPFARSEIRVQAERFENGFGHRNQLVHIPAGGKVAGGHQAIVERNGRFIIMIVYGYQSDAFFFAQQTLCLSTRFRCQYHEPGSTAAFKAGM